MVKNTNFKDAIQAVKNELASIDAEIGQLREQRRQVEQALVTRDVAKATARHTIDTAARDGRDEIAKAARLIGTGKPWDPAEILESWSNARDSFKVNKSFLLALFSDEYASKVEQAIDADPAYDQSLTNEQRTHQLAELDAKIADAEARRETLELELRDAGLLGGTDDAEEAGGGDRGLAAFHERHERQRQQTNKELANAGVTKRGHPKVINAFQRDSHIRVREGSK